MSDPRKNPFGTVYLVGAGPGDPGLMTTRGVACLRRADLVLYDYLVNPALLEYLPPGAELVCLGRHGREGLMPPEEIHARMIEAARRGLSVVRLKGGDPMVFGRAAEELAALRRAGIPYEIVPGVTAGLAAAAYAEIPVSSAEQASAIALVTAHERRGKPAEALDYRALAAFPGTLVFYMGVTSAAAWSQSLASQGMPGETPVAIVRRCTGADQQTTRTTLSDVAAVIARERMRPPAVIVVGAAAAAASERSWFSRRPLCGVRVLVTRPRHQAEDLAGPLRELGAEVLYQPAIEIAEPPDWAPVDSAIRRLEQFRWVVFSSANGVQFFLDRLYASGSDMRRLAGAGIAAIGPGTAEALARFGLRADRVPEQFQAEALAASLQESAEGKQFLLIRASRGREVLAEQLQAAGGQVEQAVAYTSRDVEQARPWVVEALDRGRIDWITVTSSAIARALVGLFGQRLRQSRLVSISPLSSQVLRGLGYAPAAEAAEATMAGVTQAIRRACGDR